MDIPNTSAFKMHSNTYYIMLNYILISQNYYLTFEDKCIFNKSFSFTSEVYMLIVVSPTD